MCITIILLHTGLKITMVSKQQHANGTSQKGKQIARGNNEPSQTKMFLFVFTVHLWDFLMSPVFLRGEFQKRATHFLSELHLSLKLTTVLISWAPTGKVENINRGQRLSQFLNISKPRRVFQPWPARTKRPRKARR